MNKHFAILFFLPLLIPCALSKPILTVGSKTFTESYILAEIIAQIAEDAGEVEVVRHFGLGGTGISFKALESGEVDVYPDYTGTVKEAILKDNSLGSLDEIKKALEKRHQLTLSPSLGFNNTYALALRQDSQREWGYQKISDLKGRSDIKTVFTHEFMKRGDGLKALERHYGFRFKNPINMEHSLAFEALNRERVDLIEVYSTDAKIKRYNLFLLEDDLGFFPRYFATLVMRKDFKKAFPKTYAALEKKLFGRINEAAMVRLNSLVELEGYTFTQVAEEYLGKAPTKASGIPLQKIGKLTLEHLKLVFVSLFFSILCGIPIGIIATRSKLLGQISLMGSGLLQTIPSLALLCFLIPLFGIGPKPAYVALFLYGLLPIVRNTYAGINQVDHGLQEAADLMGLSRWEKLRLVQMPLASVNILTGIKTSAIINVGTATLAAFIGAGGLGTLIVVGLSLNDEKIIFSGALPAALLACLIHLLFEIVDKITVPKGVST